MSQSVLPGAYALMSGNVLIAHVQVYDSGAAAVVKKEHERAVILWKHVDELRDFFEKKGLTMSVLSEDYVMLDWLNLAGLLTYQEPDRSSIKEILDREPAPDQACEICYQKTDAQQCGCCGVFTCQHCLQRVGCLCDF